MKKNIKLIILVILFILLIISLIYIRYRKENDISTIREKKMAQIFKNVDISKTADITKYIVYGTHFNLEGNLNLPKISGISVSKVDLSIKNFDNEETIIATNFSYRDDNLTFSSINNINEGIYLDGLNIDNYYIFLKVIFSNNEEKVYSFSNATEYKNIDYYTLTKNNENNLIKIDFDNYNSISYLKFDVSKSTGLPQDVYDIVIDPGHGGIDKGAKFHDEYEADIVLDCAKILKEKLENAGYKVLLTRDDLTPEDEKTPYNMYDSNGRVTVSCESHAKLLISLHMNNNSSLLSSGGVEVYAPCTASLDFAKLLADNIVNTARTTYSTYKAFKRDDGVYVHNYTNLEIQVANSNANKNQYEPYNITTSTPYLYIIRETGGIATNAFIDGRNKNFSANKYVKSNFGIESYSIDLGYMYIENDLKNVLKNKDLYMEAIANTIKEVSNN